MPAAVDTAVTRCNPGVANAGLAGSHDATARHMGAARSGTERAGPGRLESLSPVARDVLGRVPHWTLRWGLASLLGFVLLLTLLAWLVQYPDVLRGRATLTTQHPPVTLLAAHPGQVAEFRVAEAQAVRSGQVLMVLENPADTMAVERVRVWLESLPASYDGWQAADSLSDSQLIGALDSPRLGSVQPAYASFRRVYDDYRFALQTHSDKVETAALRHEVLRTRELLATRLAQRETLSIEVELLRQSHQRLASLAQQDLVSRESVAQSEREWVRGRYLQQASASEIETTRIDLSRLDRQRLDLEQTRREALHLKRLELVQAGQALQAALADWAERFVVRASIDGRVTLANLWAAGQPVSEGQELLTSVPERPATIIGRMVLPAAASGKLEPGDKVILRLDAFPHREYGHVEAEVVLVSSLSRDGQERIELSLPRGLHSTAGRDLQYQASMQADAQVLTREQRLLQRLFHRLSGSQQR